MVSEAEEEHGVKDVLYVLSSLASLVDMMLYSGSIPPKLKGFVEAAIESHETRQRPVSNKKYTQGVMASAEKAGPDRYSQALRMSEDYKATSGQERKALSFMLKHQLKISNIEDEEKDAS